MRATSTVVSVFKLQSAAERKGKMSVFTGEAQQNLPSWLQELPSDSLTGSNLGILGCGRADKSVFFS